MIAIDPGKLSSGFAVFEKDHEHTWRLFDCGFLPNDKLREKVARHSLMVSEKMRVYRQEFWKGDPNDLVDVSIELGRLMQASLDPSPVLLLPQTWKGQTPKDVMRERVTSRLSAPENLKLETRLSAIKSNVRHNVYDAVGIGLFFAGRLK